MNRGLHILELKLQNEISVIFFVISDCLTRKSKSLLSVKKRSGDRLTEYLCTTLACYFPSKSNETTFVRESRTRNGLTWQFSVSVWKNLFLWYSRRRSYYYMSFTCYGLSFELRMRNTQKKPQASHITLMSLNRHFFQKFKNVQFVFDFTAGFARCPIHPSTHPFCSWFFR